MRLKHTSEHTYMKKATVKISALALSRILFFSCFFVAIFAANTIWKNEAAWIGYLHENTLMQFSSEMKLGDNQLGYVLVNRLPIWLCLLLFGRSLFGMLMAEGFAAWQGFAIGFSLAAFMIRYGITGMILFLLTITPQAFVYILSFCLLYRMICKLYRQKRIQFLMGEGMTEYKTKNHHYIGACLVLSILYVAGILMESYVNVTLIDKMLYFLGAF